MDRISKAVHKVIRSAHQHLKQFKLPKISIRKSRVSGKEFQNPLYQQMPAKGGENPMYGLSMVLRQNTNREPYAGEVKIVARPSAGSRPCVQGKAADAGNAVTVNSAAETTARELETKLNLIEGVIEEDDVPTQAEQQERDSMMERIQSGIEKRQAEAAQRTEIIDSLNGYGSKVADLRAYTPTRGLTRQRGAAPKGEIVGGATKDVLPQPVTDDLLERLAEKLELLSKK